MHFTHFCVIPRKSDDRNGVEEFVERFNLGRILLDAGDWFLLEPKRLSIYYRFRLIVKGKRPIRGVSLLPMVWRALIERA